MAIQSPLPVNLTSAAPAMDYVAITPSDTVTLPDGMCRAIYVGVTGDVALISVSGNSVTFKSAAVGILAVSARQVKSTGTTATNLVALY